MDKSIIDCNFEIKMTDEKKYSSTVANEYTDYLLAKQTATWKRLLNVQAPYRWNLQQLKLGFVLDIGCGIGRNLINLDGHGVGVDHNPFSIAIARSHGLNAFTTEDFKASAFNVGQSFDSILLSHVAEHLYFDAVVALLRDSLYLLKPQGRLVLITPQELGFKSDSSHVEMMDFEKLNAIAEQLGLQTLKQYSFPFPRFFGYYFIYNEFISVSIKNQ